MNIVLQKAKRFYEQNIVDSYTHKEVLNKTIEEINSFFDSSDKISFLKYIINKQEVEIKAHDSFCKVKPEDCDYSIALRFYVFELQNEIKRINYSNDQFNDREIIEVKNKLNEILKNIETLKNGQEVIFNEVVEEFGNLSDSLNLGKKSWRQLLLGKMFEMTASGIVSDTVSKSVIKEFENLYSHIDFSKLLS